MFFSLLPQWWEKRKVNTEYYVSQAYVQKYAKTQWSLSLVLAAPAPAPAPSSSLPAATLCHSLTRPRPHL